MLSIFYFTSKNINRIKNEIINKDNTFITMIFQYQLLKNINTKKNFGDTIENISEHNFKCGTVPVPCLPGYFENMELIIYLIMGIHF